MKTSTIIPNAPELINEFVILRNKLQQTFLRSFSNIQDLEYLSDFPRQGVIKIDRKMEFLTLWDWYFFYRRKIRKNDRLNSYIHKICIDRKLSQKD